MNHAIHTDSTRTRSVQSLKDQARRLRASFAEGGETISHARSLELVARQFGYRDWNTAHAAAANAPDGPPVAVGGRVGGRYLGQRFAARVIGLSELGRSGRWRIELQFDEPVDVSAFESFSVLRRRVQATIRADGTTAEKTSNGQPHLVLDL